MINTALPSLVLLPGLLCTDTLWQHQVANLADICNPYVADLTKDDSISAMAKRVLDNAPERFVLVGLSMGGYVSFEIMRQAPERIICLSLMDTQASLDTPEKLSSRKGLLGLCKQGRFLGVTPRFLPSLIHEDYLNTTVADDVIGMSKALTTDVFVRQQTAIINRVDSTPLLPNINVPTLIIVGENDKVTPPSEAAKMAALIPNNEFHLLERCGHLAPLERSALVTDLLREWLLKHIA